MDSFNLLKYWRTSTKASASSTNTPAPEALTSPETATDDDDSTDDDGSFFDLEFAENRVREEDEENEVLEHEQDFNFTLNSSDANESQPIPPSDELFFKGQLVPLEQSSIVISAGDNDLKPQLAVPLMKSATKFRVFILGLRKSKSIAAAGVSPKQSKLFFINFKVEEAPIVSLFTRDSSSRNQACVAKTMEKDTDDGEEATVAPAAASVEEKMKSSNSKEVVQKYLSKIKPLYVRVSKRYADKLRFSGPLVHGEIPSTELGSKEEMVTQLEDSTELKVVEKNIKLALPAKLRVAYERLGKSRAAAVSTVAAVSSPPLPPQRRDDSLLQQEDGIQSAIAHCKRSFTASSEETESPLQLSENNPVAECVQLL